MPSSARASALWGDPSPPPPPDPIWDVTSDETPFGDPVDPEPESDPDTKPDSDFIPDPEPPSLQIAETGGDPAVLAEPAIGKIPEFPANRRTLYKIREEMHHHWMLTRLEVDKVNCNIYMDQKGEPSHREVLGYCGYRVYQMWLQGVCLQTNDRETPCEGLTLHYIGPMEEKLRYSINLPGSVAYSGLVNCYPWGVCGEWPQMFFGGIDPLATQQISLVHLDFEDGQKFVCAAGECAFPMPPTLASGMQATYYVSSTYGDDSLKITFRYRNLDLGDGTFLFQLIGSDWD
ncbi:MAG: hypothetical protein ACK2T7_03485, partial [Anaerolineales bacterium]